MSRKRVVCAAQTGPIPRGSSRADVVSRLIRLLDEAADRGADFVVFGELALTPFFPHWSNDADELAGYFDTAMPNDSVRPLFARAAERGVAFCLGFAELTPDGHRYNSSVLVGGDGDVRGIYRKVHLPGYDSIQPSQPFQNLEKKHFESGPDGFGVWDCDDARIGLCICNDRRWPETYRCLALQGAELVALGYNTPTHDPELPDLDPLRGFHNLLVMQANAYSNSMWVVATARGGVEEGVAQVADSCIIAPDGRIVARASTSGDECVLAEVDLDYAAELRRVWNFERNRHPEHYRLIAEGPADS